MHNIFDSHAHYDDGRFDPDRHELLAGMPAKGVRLIMNAAADLASAEAGIALAERWPFIVCSAGVHPHEAKDAPDDLRERIAALAKHPKVKAVGEIGLDYHYDFSPREKQLEVFEAQLQAALELDLPVIVHDREAHADTLRLLAKYKPRGVVHCFSGSAEMARELVRLGFYIGFTGVVTFPNARKTLEAARAVPIDRLLVETDCPYMAPVPFRGSRCDSSMIAHTAAALAREKDMDVQELLDRTCRNAMALYGVEENAGLTAVLLLPGDDLSDCFAIRLAVFSDEQGFSREIEIDGTDDSCEHILLLLDGIPAATGRLFPDPEDQTRYWIGRVAVKKDLRGSGAGRLVMSELEERAKSLGAKTAVLSAQTHARPFYEKCGYTASGGEYLDEHCPHIHMEKEL